MLPNVQGLATCDSSMMLINPGSHRPQGPWDPNEKKKWIDTTNFWILLPILIILVVAMTLGIMFEN